MDDIAPGELRRTPGPTFTPIPDPQEETDPLRAAIRNALGPHARHLELRGEDDKWRPAVDVLEAALRPLVPAGVDVDPHAVDLADVPEDRIRKADQ